MDSKNSSSRARASSFNRVAVIPWEQKNLYISTGITSEILHQLIENTRSDKIIQKNTSDMKRFSSKKSYEAWKKRKHRTMYVLTDQKEHQLYGVFWLGPSKLPSTEYTKTIEPDDFDTTSAIRLYQNARGSGIAKAFYDHCVTDYIEKLDPLIKGLWVGVYKDNIASMKFHSKVGYEPISKPDKTGHVFLVRKF